jgi:hypothetical protein
VYAYGGALGAWEDFIISGLHSSSPEPTFVSEVTLRTVLRDRYVGAQNGGGGAVSATATSAQGWQLFTIQDINGGDLESGDAIFITAENAQMWQAWNGGGSTLNAGSNNQLGWETFRIVRRAGSGRVVAGDVVGLQTSGGAWVSAESGGGGTVYAYGGAFGSWEEFRFGRGATAEPDPEPDAWRTADLTWYTSYPDPGSEECIEYNGCTWAGQFAALPDKMPESWVAANNIAAVHGKDFERYRLKTLRLRQGTRQIDVVVYDMCSDSDCSGCCSANSSNTGFLIDIESYTADRFGTRSGIVEWMCLDC